jgi:hypothetical protein
MLRPYRGTWQAKAPHPSPLPEGEGAFLLLRAKTKQSLPGTQHSTTQVLTNEGNRIAIVQRTVQRVDNV